jgi:hypothetical protein
MSKEKDDRLEMLIIALLAFAFGYLVASVILDKRPVTEEDMIELNKQQYYE